MNEPAGVPIPCSVRHCGSFGRIMGTGLFIPTPPTTEPSRVRWAACPVHEGAVVDALQRKDMAGFDAYAFTRR